MPKLLMVAAATAVTILGAALMPGSAQAQTVVVRDNSSNSIVRGGTVTKEELIAKAEANDPSDLQAIYSAYGLDPDQYANVRQNAKMGVAYKNGDIVVAGRVVARNTSSLGREQKPYATAKTINGKTYYESRSQDVFASNSIPVIVVLDDDGRFVAGVLTACGNPIRGTPVEPPARPTPRPPVPQPAPQPVPPPAPTPVTPVEKPVTAIYRCDSLRGVRRANGTDLQYDFTVQASHTNARVSYVDFDFGDGTDAPGVRPPARTVGSTSSNNNTSGNGTTYQQPAQGSNSTPGITTYDYSTGTYNTTGTTSTSGSGTTYSGASGATAGRTTITQSHDFAQPGTYRVRATVYFNPTNGATVAGDVENDTCEIQFATQRTPVTPVATPPAAPPAAPLLPATGVGEFVALFTGVSVLGSAGYYIYTKRRLAGL